MHPVCGCCFEHWTPKKISELSRNEEPQTKKAVDKYELTHNTPSVLKVLKETIMLSLICFSFHKLFASIDVWFPFGFGKLLFKLMC